MKNITDDMFRANAKIGNGSTAAAVRYEKAMGKMVGGKEHLEKAENYSIGLKIWLKNNQNNPNVSENDCTTNVTRFAKCIKGKVNE
ncbi:hypothetical protein [Acinetobacter sp. YH12145]|uniref:hypothetical protein n=1 Tax=Acinetobacter sp. YH12145 TaxID=2601129 RepID=UPI001C55663C|nr:hypothetical protein [Acinetobacter sp. YH12145]